MQNQKSAEYVQSGNIVYLFDIVQIDFPNIFLFFDTQFAL